MNKQVHLPHIPPLVFVTLPSSLSLPRIFKGGGQKPIPLSLQVNCKPSFSGTGYFPYTVPTAIHLVKFALGAIFSGGSVCTLFGGIGRCSRLSFCCLFLFYCLLVKFSCFISPQKTHWKKLQLHRGFSHS